MTDTASEDDEPLVCSNPDCRVSETGRCVEGHELDTCPYFGQEAEEEAEVEPEDAEEERTGVRLPSSDALTTVEASAVLCACHARVVAIVGPTDSGKTSLIASVYDKFQEGPISDIEFSRSHTLHAFEHTCHDARMASRRGVPHTPRTPRGNVRFYHLEVGLKCAGERLALLLADRAGEEYRAAADDISVAADFPEVLRSDTLTVLVDGGRLVDTGARHNLRSEVTMMMQGLCDGGGIRTGMRLALVLTKRDVVDASPNRDRARQDFHSLMESMRRLFGNVLTDIQQFEVAASPKTETLPRGTGVPELLTFWLSTPKPRVTASANAPNSDRVFARLRPLDVQPDEAHE